MSGEKRRIGVMMGGCSGERGISYKSGKAVCEALRRAGEDVLALEVFQETEEEVRRLIAENAVDGVFVAMHGGFGEDGRLQRILENAGMPYTGSQEKACALAMNKILSRRIFQKFDLDIPRGRAIDGGEIFEDSDYPLVIKPVSQGSSLGVSLVKAPCELKDALGKALALGGEVLVEEFVEGKEVTVSVLGGQALPIVEIIADSPFFDYQAKYENVSTRYVVPANLEVHTAEKARTDAVAAYHALGCRHFSRIDMIIRKGGTPCLLEVNTIPGLTEVSLFPKAAEAAGISFDQLCVRLVDMAFKTFVMSGNLG